ncbi:MAG: DUF3179 domain-containing (seleno)protein [Candidatus Cyclobacteriaceae bacterium M2_1C_046]
MKQKLFLLCMVLLVTSCTEEDVDLLPVFSNSTANQLINDYNGSAPFVIYKRGSLKIFLGFSRISPKDGSTLVFDTTAGAFPNVFKDQNNEEWNIFGEGISEGNTGYNLTALSGMPGYWFAFPAIYDTVEVESIGLIKSSDLGSKEFSSEILVDPQRLFQGALKDGIPSIDNPQFTTWASFNSDQSKEDLLFASGDTTMFTVYKAPNDKIYALPHNILNWHEIVNHLVGDFYYNASFCPLTGTSQVWKSKSQFGVSGILYNSNLVLYDRDTESLWSQVLQLCIEGDRIGDQPERVHFFECNYTALETLAQYENEIIVLTQETGFTRDYDVYPYGSYKSSSTVHYPLDFESDLFHPKERVFAQTNDCYAKIYHY